jgi:multidrug efflux pump
MEFVDWKERRKANEILAEIRERTKDLSGIIIETSKQEQGPPSGKPVYLRVSSRFPEKINSIAELMLKKVNAMDGLKDIEDNRNKPEIEWKLTVDRAEAGKFGASVSSVGQFVQLVTNGFKVGSFRSPDADDEIDIILRYPLENRGVSQLDNLRVNTSAGAVPVSNFVVRAAQQKVGTVYRAEGQRIVEIKADIKDGVLADTKIRELGDYIKKAYAAGEIPPEVKVEFKGENEDQQKSGSFLAGAFLLALVSMFIMLLTQFNSAFAAFVIMTAVFFSTIGVLLGLLVMHEPFGVVMCGVGIIALAGVVVSNNIIFIDFYMELKKQGYATFDALVESGKQRLRPILLTAGTAVVGLLPMVFQLNLDFIHREVTVGAPSTQWWTQLSTAIAGGLTFATALTLFFTPCLIFWAERTLGIRLYEEKKD